MITPKNLYILYSKNVDFLQKLIINNLSEIVDNLIHTDINDYNWNNAFDETNLSFIKILDSNIRFKFILDDSQKSRYLKVFLICNRKVQNIEIFLDILSCNPHVIVSNLTNTNSKNMFYILTYYYKNKLIVQLSTFLLNFLRIDYTQINVNYDADINENLIIFNKDIISLLKMFVKII